MSNGNDIHAVCHLRPVDVTQDIDLVVRGESDIQTSLTGASVLSQPDVTLMLDTDAVIQSVTVSNTFSGEFVKTWLGRPWIETVADSGVDKVQLSLDDARVAGLSAYRRILQRFPSGLEMPIEYTTVRLGDAGMIAIGRNLQGSSELQSRLIAAQQAMERDYWKLREVETRYRLLFDASNDAVLVLSSDDLRVVEANPAAIRALGLTRGWDFIAEMPQREHEPLRQMLARVLESGRSPGGVFHIGADQAPWILRASRLSDDDVNLFMVQLVSVERPGQGLIASPGPIALSDFASGMPDGFVMLDRDGIVRSANPAFVDMIQAKAEDKVVGHGLGRWLGRPEDDLSHLLSGLKSHGRTPLFATSLRGERGRRVQVEISAGASKGDDPACFAAVVREVSRRRAEVDGRAGMPALPPLLIHDETPLKTLVQAAVEVVERHYVESALKLTDGNRTAAAERLGLSRQSLYSKLNRYGLDGGSEATSGE